MSLPERPLCVPATNLGTDSTMLTPGPSKRGKSGFPFWTGGTSCQSPTFGKKDADVPSSLGEPETTGTVKGPGWCRVSDAQLWGMLLNTELQS